VFYQAKNVTRSLKKYVFQLKYNGLSLLDLFFWLSVGWLAKPTNWGWFTSPKSKKSMLRFPENKQIRVLSGPFDPRMMTTLSP